jgi:lysosomal alpha-mannosidase
MVINSALNNVSPQQHIDADIEYTFCDYLNISVCPATETSKPFTITVYNPIARTVDTNIRIPVSSEAVKIFGPDGNPVPIAIKSVTNATKFVRGNLGNAKYELTFSVTGLPPLGVAVFTGNTTSNTEHASKVPSKSSSKFLKKSDIRNGVTSDEEYVISNKYLRLAFSLDSGRLTNIANVESGISVNVDQEFLWYNASSIGNAASDQASGAYIFRPNASEPFSVGSPSSISMFQSDVFQEVHQVFGPWLSQTVRLYSNKPYAEFEYTVGPIKMAASPDLGKEVISRFDTSLKTDAVFYTDANGREMQMRKRNYRPTWTYNGK